MRTPGNDIDLTLGFLFTEGLITDPHDVSAIRYCDSFDDSGRNTYNVIDVTLAPGISLPDTGIERNFYTTSSCGVCGKASLDAIRQRTLHPPARDSCRVTADVLAGLPDRMRTAQKTFARTGGLHAAGLFTTSGDHLALRCRMSDALPRLGQIPPDTDKYGQVAMQFGHLRTDVTRNTA
ncbi:formate dehydrogenase accessory sulfurtransferase FdhD [Gordonia rubripertincta]|nr:putative FdhD protein homolog [Gordonia rubripertincta NBRC 101908]